MSHIVKYQVKTYGKWITPYWKNEASKKDPAVTSANTYVYSDLSPKVFEDVLRDELDVPSYALTPKSIKKEFGYLDNGLDISDACIKRIIAYYKFRKCLFEKICKLLLNNNAESMLDKTGADKLSFTYMLPAEYNNFSCEDPEYDGGQQDAWLEISVCR